MTHTKDEALHRAQSAISYTILALSNGNDLTYAKACLESALTAIKQALEDIKQALATPVQEPVAWVDSVMEQAQVFASAWSLVGGRFDFGNGFEDAEQAKAELRAMLTTPPAAPVPLTDEQITAISKQVAEGGPEDSIDRFVRAIEAAHGITKGQP
jgi:hypothetical protein